MKTQEVQKSEGFIGISLHRKYVTRCIPRIKKWKATRNLILRIIIIVAIVTCGFWAFVVIGTLLALINEYYMLVFLIALTISTMATTAFICNMLPVKKDEIALSLKQVGRHDRNYCRKHGISPYLRYKLNMLTKPIAY